ARFCALERLLAGERPRAEGDRRRMLRMRCPLPVGFTLAGKFGSGRILDIGGGGMAITTAAPAFVGDEILVHIHDPSDETEHVFPARVVWRRAGDAPAMGVAFEGIPTETVPSLRGRRHRRRRYTPMVA
ncbi:MAG: PilZ domain-containing protein, partial [Polyangiales bacterium]